jgi:hypothetical protein
MSSTRRRKREHVGIEVGQLVTGQQICLLLERSRWGGRHVEVVHAYPVRSGPPLTYAIRVDGWWLVLFHNRIAQMYNVLDIVRCSERAVQNICAQLAYKQRWRAINCDNGN